MISQGFHGSLHSILVIDPRACLVFNWPNIVSNVIILAHPFQLSLWRPSDMYQSYMCIFGVILGQVSTTFRLFQLFCLILYTIWRINKNGFFIFYWHFVQCSYIKCLEELRIKAPFRSGDQWNPQQVIIQMNGRRPIPRLELKSRQCSLLILRIRCHIIS